MDKTLIYKEDLQDALLSHFGVDLAYYGEDLQFCQEAVDLAPAVDAVEVVHGQWEKSEPGYRICSKCRADVAIFSGHRSYCPNCGAKMDGGDTP